MPRIHGLCPECGLSRDLAEDYDKVRTDLNGCETDYSNMRKENDRLRALATDLRNRLYLRGENVNEADALLLGAAAAPDAGG